MREAGPTAGARLKPVGGHGACRGSPTPTPSPLLVPTPHPQPESRPIWLQHGAPLGAGGGDRRVGSRIFHSPSPCHAASSPPRLWEDLPGLGPWELWPTEESERVCKEPAFGENAMGCSRPMGVILLEKRGTSWGGARRKAGPRGEGL